MSRVLLKVSILSHFPPQRETPPKVNDSPDSVLAGKFQNFLSTLAKKCKFYDGVFHTVFYFYHWYGSRNFYAPPLLFRNFQISQMAKSFIAISHKSSTNFQKVSQNFTKLNSEKNNLQLKNQMWGVRGGGGESVRTVHLIHTFYWRGGETGA